MNKWFIGYKERGEDLFDLSDMHIIMPPEGRYYADPFILGDMLFFEDYDYKKGKISSIDLNAPDEIPTVELELGHHLSFPHVFRHDEKLYMVPEEGAINKIQLYRRVLGGWVMIKVIKEGIHAGDTQISKIGDWWYLFTTNGGDNNLWIERTQDLMGEWQYVWSGEAKNSRPAGRIFEYEGKLIRPVQDTSEQYGAKVILKEILEEETPLAQNVWRTLEPDWYPNLTGFHTFNFNDKWVVVDGRIDA